MIKLINISQIFVSSKAFIAPVIMFRMTLNQVFNRVDDDACTLISISLINFFIYGLDMNIKASILITQGIKKQRTGFGFLDQLGTQVAGGQRNAKVRNIFTANVGCMIRQNDSGATLLQGLEN